MCVVCSSAKLDIHRNSYSYRSIIHYTFSPLKADRDIAFHLFINLFSLFCVSGINRTRYLSTDQPESNWNLRSIGPPNQNVRISDARWMTGTNSKSRISILSGGRDPRLKTSQPETHPLWRSRHFLPQRSDRNRWKCCFTNILFYQASVKSVTFFSIKLVVEVSDFRRIFQEHQAF